MRLKRKLIALFFVIILALALAFGLLSCSQAGQVAQPNKESQAGESIYSNTVETPVEPDEGSVIVQE